MDDRQIQIWKIDDLRNHPLNIEVFGDKPDEEMVESVGSRGVIQPLVITPDGQIISGHRRKQSAKMAGMDAVPCIVRDDLTDEVDIIDEWWNSNVQRVMTTEQKYRWINARVSRAPAGKKAKAKKEAAEEVGISKRSADRLQKAVEALDEAEAAGDHEKAEELREALNNGSIAKAEKLAQPPKKQDPRTAAKNLVNLYKKLVQASEACVPASRKVKDAEGGPGVYYEEISSLSKKYHKQIKAAERLAIKWMQDT